MLLRLLGKLLWGTTKLSLKYVVVPLAISAAVGAAAGALAESIRDGSPEPNGRVEPTIKPGK